MQLLKNISEKIATIGLKDTVLDAKEIGKLRLINSFSIISILTILFNLPLYFYWGLSSFAYLLIIQSGCYMISVYANYKGNYWFAKIMMVSQINIATTFIINMLGEYVMLQLLFIPLLGLALILFTSQELYSRIWCIILTCVCFFITETIDYHFFAPIKVSPDTALIIRSVIIIVSLALNLLILFIYSNSLEKAESDAVKKSIEINNKNQELSLQKLEIHEKNEELNQMNEELHSNMELVQYQNKQIKKSNEDVKASITYASRIQNALLPFDDRMQEYFGENFFILYKPRDIVSGDFYWCENVHDSIILAVADCTGHGVPGAFMSMLGSMGLNSVIFQDNNFEANKILNGLHNYIFNALRQDKNDSRDGMDIALIVINPAINMVEYAGAMNPLYYIQKGELFILKGDNQPIGGGQYGTSRNFTKHTIDTSLPTTLYLSTDGYQDQFGGKEKRKFMTGNFKKLLHQVYPKNITEQKSILNNTIEAWMQEGNEHQIDDILIVGLKIG
jgi:serine phosphatase RsbU (regulator of sigma subunit)